jgi:hypothetical protein
MDAEISARELAVRCHWHESKTSRIENARTAPSGSDIRAWCRACGADDRAADLIEANRQSAEASVEWQRLQRAGLRRLQESVTTLYRRTRLFRVYCSDVVPGFLQTPAYASALLSSIAAFRAIPDDVSDAVEARMKRNSVVTEGDHRSSFVLEESVLRYRIADTDTMAGQLGHLLSAMTFPRVSLGIIPFSAQRSLWPVATFTIFDTNRVHADSLEAAHGLTQPSQVDLYLRAFDRLSQCAVHGAAARSLLANALTALDEQR